MRQRGDVRQTDYSLFRRESPLGRFYPGWAAAWPLPTRSKDKSSCWLRSTMLCRLRSFARGWRIPAPSLLSGFGSVGRSGENYLISLGFWTETRSVFAYNRGVSLLLPVLQGRTLVDRNPDELALASCAAQRGAEHGNRGS